MLKFIKGHASSIDGIEIYPIISLTIFFLFFLGLMIYVARTKRAYIQHMSHIPLDEEMENHANHQPQMP